MKGCGWVGSRKEGGNEQSRHCKRKMWGLRGILKCNAKRQSLGAEWSMSEVGIPPPYNLDKLHALVTGIKNNNNNIKVATNCFPKSEWFPVETLGVNCGYNFPQCT